MFTQRWTSRAAIFTTIGMLISVTLPAFTNKRVFAQTPPVQSQCSDVNIQKYIKQLNKAETTAFNALVECNSQAIPALIKALKNPYVNTKIITVAALGEIGENAEPAIPYLTKLLKNKNQDINIIATHALGEIGEAAIPALIKVLKNNKNWQVRYIAADALSQMGTKAKKAVPALIKASKKDKDWYVRNKAEDAVRKIRRHKLDQILFKKNQEISILDVRYEFISRIIARENRFRSIIRKEKDNNLNYTRELGNLRVRKFESPPLAEPPPLLPPAPISEEGNDVQQKITTRTRSLQKTITNAKKKPPVMCKIPVLKAIFKWKCPSKGKK